MQKVKARFPFPGRGDIMFFFVSLIIASVWGIAEARVGNQSKGPQKNNFTVGEASCLILREGFRAQIWVRFGRDD